MDRLSSTIIEKELSAIATEKLPAFMWGVGIECSFIPHMQVDQFEWTQHNQFWRDDLRKAREELGVSHLRYAMPWHLIEKQRGKFDWASADERIEFCDSIGLKLMMDVMHFGTPTWLPQAVGDPRFPESLESYTEQLVGRYRGSINSWCPFNEPLVSALFSGDFGFWPPHGRKWRGYMPVLSRIVQAVNRSIAAIRRTQPDATVMLCDALENFQTRSPELKNEVALRNMRRFVVLDLLAGRVDHEHLLYGWLTAFGFSELDLAYFRANPQMPDLIGLDYYPHSDWQIEWRDGGIRQRRADYPIGIYPLAKAIFDRYGLPMIVSETSVDGPPISREIWLQSMVEQIKQLRDDGIPMAGLFWWPLFDQIDWDGALTHRIGKIHNVGLYSLNRQPDGVLKRTATPLVKVMRDLVEAGDESVGTLGEWVLPAPEQDQSEPLLDDASQWSAGPTVAPTLDPAATISPTPKFKNVSQQGKNGHSADASTVTQSKRFTSAGGEEVNGQAKQNDRFGIVVFSHLRWGFVWQRPQQFLSRFAKHHPILFVEEPWLDLPPGSEPRMDIHRVLPNVTVACPHGPPELASDPSLFIKLREWVNESIQAMNHRGEFDMPLLWYYSPMDAAWSLGHFPNRGVVYDCMDELSQFTGSPVELVENERRLMEYSDVVFTGGYELWTKKSAVHPNAQFYGCGVEFDHFNLAQQDATTIPPDIDFLPRPIIGWFGVVDERVDYQLLADIARMRPNWSLAIVGPVVKVDPNLLPHAPNLHWLGGRDYRMLPNYCRAFDVCMMAFAINKATEFINPTKALEYLATGKPVISTPVKDVIRQYSDYVEIASTAEEFVAKIDEMLRSPNQARIQAGLDLARRKSWESNVTEMRQHIHTSIASSQRSSATAKPSPDPAPGYVYKETPGS